MTKAEKLILENSRNKYEQLAREWVHEHNIKRGGFKSHAGPMMGAFIEWLEERDPALVARYRIDVSINMWVKHLKRIIPKLKVRRRAPKSAAIYTNRVIRPQHEVAIRNTQCQSCGALRFELVRVEDITVEELKKHLKR